VKNVGTVAATNVVLRDQLPDNARFIGLGAGRTCSGADAGILDCPIGTLGASQNFAESAAIQFQVTAPEVSPFATVVNHAEASATNADSDDSILSLRVTPPKLRIAQIGFVSRMSGSPEVTTNKPAFAPGQQVQVRVAIKNDGGPLRRARIHVKGEHPDSDQSRTWDSDSTEIIFLSVTAHKQPYLVTVKNDAGGTELSFEAAVPIDRPLQPSEVVDSAFGISGGIIESPNVEAPALPPAEVDGAIQQRPPLQLKASDHTTCRWLSSTVIRFKTTPATRGKCTHPIWLRAHGLRHWSLRLRHRLPRGRYTLYVRVIDTRGAFDPIFSRKHHNVFTVTVR
jgi:hypothetical protein